MDAFVRCSDYSISKIVIVIAIVAHSIQEKQETPLSNMCVWIVCSPRAHTMGQLFPHYFYLVHLCIIYLPWAAKPVEPARMGGQVLCEKNKNHEWRHFGLPTATAAAVQLQSAFCYEPDRQSVLKKTRKPTEAWCVRDRTPMITTKMAATTTIMGIVIFRSIILVCWSPMQQPMLCHPVPCLYMSVVFVARSLLLESLAS